MGIQRRFARMEGAVAELEVGAVFHRAVDRDQVDDAAPGSGVNRRTGAANDLDFPDVGNRDGIPGKASAQHQSALILHHIAVDGHQKTLAADAPQRYLGAGVRIGQNSKSGQIAQQVRNVVDLTGIDFFFDVQSRLLCSFKVVHWLGA